MIGLLAMGEAGRPLAGELHALWSAGSTVYRVEDGGESPGDVLERALGECRQLVCFAPVGSIVRLLLLRRPPAGPDWRAPDGAAEIGAAGGVRGADGLGRRADGLGGVGVVAVDPERRFAVSLTGRDGGADDLARAVSARLGTCPVVTGGRAADRFAPDGSAPVERYDDDRPLRGADEDVLRCPPLPARPRVRAGDLVVGVGLREATAPPEVTRLIHRVLAEAGLDHGSLARLATLAGKGDHPAVRRAATLLGLPVDEHTAEELTAVTVPNPSVAVGAAVGTTSVAEAAALASAPGGAIVVPKQKSATVTVAVARAAVRGRLAVVGLGPGERDLVVPRAEAELRRATAVVGAPGALELAAGFLRPGARRFTASTAEDCAGAAVELATRREAVALVALGDGLGYDPPPADGYDLVRVPGLPLAPPAAVPAVPHAAPPAAVPAVPPAVPPVDGDRP
ncbi:cobalamin biosynthesis protein [Kitasatospora sp. NPDC127111]|uniref:cobalamin biosynthesis protein n=1 Tax=Kitasatospora sp. NPDC127111 TaxID=3345363 RepID=UPI0036364EA2